MEICKFAPIWIIMVMILRLDKCSATEISTNVSAISDKIGKSTLGENYS